MPAGPRCGDLREGRAKSKRDSEKELRRRRGGKRTRVPWERKTKETGDRHTDRSGGGGEQGKKEPGRRENGASNHLPSQ